MSTVCILQLAKPQVGKLNKPRVFGIQQSLVVDTVNTTSKRISKSYTFNGTPSCYPAIQRWQCLIHNGILKVRDRLGEIFESRVQYCRDKFQDSFVTLRRFYGVNSLVNNQTLQKF